VIPKVYAEVPRSAHSLEHELFLEEVVLRAVREGLCPAGEPLADMLEPL
jgi:hypothetical protein